MFLKTFWMRLSSQNNPETYLEHFYWVKTHACMPKKNGQNRQKFTPTPISDVKGKGNIPAYDITGKITVVAHTLYRENTHLISRKHIG